MRVEILGLRVAAPLGGACSCYAVSRDSTLVLLDLGPGALQRVWERELLGELDAIVISHMHMDHMLDLLPLSGELGLTALNEARRDAPKLPVFVPTETGIRRLADVGEAIGSSRERCSQAFDLREYDDRAAVTIGALSLSFAPTAHSERCFAPRIGDGRSSVVYGADGEYSDALVAHAAHADLLLLEATLVEPDPTVAGHMTGEQAARVAAQAGARRLVLTHLPPSTADNEDNLHRARGVFDGEVELAETGAVYEV